jgi:hypothetical protein
MLQLFSGTVGPIDAQKVFSIASTMRLVLGAWFAIRIFFRHFGARHANHVETPGGVSFLRTALFYDDCADLLSFGLLAGPTTLNHHYVMAIPIILWTVCKNGAIKPFQIIVGCLMMSNFQSRITNLMPFAPLGLLLLAHARSACTTCGLIVLGKQKQASQAHEQGEAKQPVGAWK